MKRLYHEGSKSIWHDRYVSTRKICCTSPAIRGSCRVSCTFCSYGTFCCPPYNFHAPSLIRCTRVLRNCIHTRIHLTTCALAEACTMPWSGSGDQGSSSGANTPDSEWGALPSFRGGSGLGTARRSSDAVADCSAYRSGWNAPGSCCGDDAGEAAVLAAAAAASLSRRSRSSSNNASTMSCVLWLVEDAPVCCAGWEAALAVASGSPKAGFWSSWWADDPTELDSPAGF